MKKLYVHDYTVAGSNQPQRWENLMTETLVPIFSNFNNLTYIGMASSGDRREMVFQIGNCTNRYLRLHNGGSTGAGADDQRLMVQWSATDSLSTVNTWIDTNETVDVGRVTIETTGVCTFSLWYLTDENNNLRCFWSSKRLNQATNDNAVYLFLETVDNREIIVRSNQYFSNFRVGYLDDSEYTSYYINYRNLVYDSLNEVLIDPIICISNTPGETFIYTSNFVIDNKLVQIYNRDLGGYWTNNTHGYNSADARKIIQVGNDYYTQLINQFWYKDIDGDLVVIEKSDATTQTT